MLAKYVPGGIWTPAARVLWLRRAGGIVQTPVVVASILLEAGLSAVAGVLVLLCALPWVGPVDAPLFLLVPFAAGVAALLHPRVFRAVTGRTYRPFGAAPPPALRWRTMLGLLAFYSGTWVVGGVALMFVVRSVGGDVDLSQAPYLGGIAAVGAIVAVLSILAPSGLGVREASMYGLLLAVTSPPVALGATVLNRLAITLVEAALLAAGVLLWRSRKCVGREFSSASLRSASFGAPGELFCPPCSASPGQATRSSALRCCSSGWGPFSRCVPQACCSTGSARGSRR